MTEVYFDLLCRMGHVHKWRTYEDNVMVWHLRIDKGETWLATIPCNVSVGLGFPCDEPCTLLSRVDPAVEAVVLIGDSDATHLFMVAHLWGGRCPVASNYPHRCNTFGWDPVR